MSNKVNEEILIVETLPINTLREGTYAISQPNPNSFTHAYFKYPCKFIPEIPRWAIKKYASDEKSIIFDPFSGSGTTLLESIIIRHKAYGTEIDDIAKLLIKVKTTQLLVDEIELSRKILEEIKSKIDDENIKVTQANINNIEHWFPNENINQLGRIRTIIEDIANERVRDFFKVCLATIIKKCSFADNVSPKPYVSSKIKKTPSVPIVELESIFTRYITLMKEFSDIKCIGKAEIVEGDALNVGIDFTVDLIITSPPYINAFDYGRTLRLENLWLGFLSEEKLRSKKADYVGTEKVDMKLEEQNLDILCSSKLLEEYYHKISPIDKKRAIIVKRFFEDMKVNLLEMYRILKNNGHYCIVIGNSNIRKIEIESWKVLRDIAESIGFEEVECFSYIIQNPYIRIPRSGRGGKVNKDYVLVLKK